jgi:hypothetical protein
MLLRLDFLLFLLTIHSIAHTTHGLVVKGRLNTKADWVFMAKFCFVSRESQFIFNLNSPDSYAVQSLVLYYDFQWSKVYPSSRAVNTSFLFNKTNKKIQLFFFFSISKPCQDRLDIVAPSQALEMDPVTSFLNCYHDKSNQLISCNDERGFITSRPRWWFVVLSRCNSSVNGTLNK